MPRIKYLRINNHRFQNYYNNNNFRYNTYGVDKIGGGYLLQSYKSYGLKQPIDYLLRSFLGFFLRAVGSIAL
jgi:hypothetical protein